MAYIRRGIGAYGPASNEPFFPFSPNRPSSGDGCGCGGTCGGCGDHGHGMGQIDLSSVSTPVLIGGGLLGAYVLIHAWEDVRSKTVKGAYRKTKKGAKAAASGTGSVIKYALIAGAAYAAYYFYSQYQAGTLPGLGDYMAQGYTGPQILNSPIASADILIPAGW